MRLARPRDAGFTLAELQVVMLLLAALSVMAATVSIDYLRGVETHRQRTAMLGDLQAAVELTTRELRAADPLVSASLVACELGRQPATATPVASCANELVLELERRGSRLRFTYALVAGELRQTRQQWTGSAWDAGSTRALARGLDNGPAPQSPLFALSDTAGRPVGGLSDVSRIDVRLVGRGLNRSPVVVTAEAAVRNAVYRRSTD